MLKSLIKSFNHKRTFPKTRFTDKNGIVYVTAPPEKFFEHKDMFNIQIGQVMKQNKWGSWIKTDEFLHFYRREKEELGITFFEII